MSLNKVMLIGNVGRDPEVRYLEGNGQNTKVATFTLATTERYKDRNGEPKENTEWHNIVAWRQTAEFAEKYVKKGSQLYIEGRLRTRSYTDQQGIKKYTTEISVDNLQLLGRRNDDQQQGQYQQQAPSQQSFQPQPQAHGGFQGQGGFQSQNTYQAPTPSNTSPAVDIDDASDDLPF